MRHTIIIAAAVAALLAPAPSVHASEPYGCLTFDDGSFACGKLIDATTAPNDPDPNAWFSTIDPSSDWITGCIPSAPCDSSLARIPLKRHRASNHTPTVTAP